jgi:glucose/arabinose dehydrogenase
VYLPGSGLRSAAYLDIRSRVQSGGERGLLGLAFHPNYKSNGYFYVDYTDSNGDINISRFHATPSSNAASASSEKLLLKIPHSTYANHNGGQLAFWGGYLYIGVGDGGSGGDPSGNAQNLNSLLGKILRIDVDHTCGSRAYCSPVGNPFRSSTSARHEIWLYGLRNPWRFGFDSASGAQWIGDVGQNTYEEIDDLGAGVGGRNMGWDCREGTLNTVSQYGGSYCSGRSFTGPIYQYGHSNGRCAIVGGFVYRGAQYASVMKGLYLYGDYCTGEMWALARTSSGTVSDFVGKRSASITSFGQSISGEIYVVDTDGNLSHVTARRI